jgi:hypothetical protein
MSSTKSDRSPPVSDGRVTDCLKSARFWAEELPRYANRMQFWADFWAISAGLIAALTGLAIWPVLGESPTTTEKVVVSVGALLSATCALVPRVLNHGERAGAARELSSRYGSIIGLLEDLHHVSAEDYPDAALKAVTAFESTKEKKDALRRVGSREQMVADRRIVEQRAQGALKQAHLDLVNAQGTLRSELAEMQRTVTQEQVELAKVQGALQQEIEMHGTLKVENANLAKRQDALRHELMALQRAAQ